MRFSRTFAVLMLLAVLTGGCAKEEEFVEPDTFSFVVYPGARYLGQLTETTKSASKFVRPNQEVPPIAIYDSEASVDEVANFYVKSYGYSTIAPDATNNMSAAKPPAYRRTGDLAEDNRVIESLLKQMNLPTDVSKAQGSYQAVEIEPRPNRPRVTIQRPYFDVTTSQVVDRTLIMMAR